MRAVSPGRTLALRPDFASHASNHNFRTEYHTYMCTYPHPEKFLKLFSKTP